MEDQTASGGRVQSARTDTTIALQGKNYSHVGSDSMPLRCFLPPALFRLRPFLTSHLAIKVCRYHKVQTLF